MTYEEEYNLAKRECTSIKNLKNGVEAGYREDGSVCYTKDNDGTMSLYFSEFSHPYYIIKSNGEKCHFFAEQYCAIAEITDKKGISIESYNGKVITSVSDSKGNKLEYGIDGKLECFTDAKGNKLSFKQDGTISTYERRIEKDGVYKGTATYNKEGELLVVRDELRHKNVSFLNGKVNDVFDENNTGDLLKKLSSEKVSTLSKMKNDRIAFECNDFIDRQENVNKAINQAEQNAKKLDEIRNRKSHSITLSETQKTHWEKEWEKHKLINGDVPMQEKDNDKKKMPVYPLRTGRE